MSYEAIVGVLVWWATAIGAVVMLIGFLFMAIGLPCYLWKKLMDAVSAVYAKRAARQLIEDLKWEESVAK